MNQSSTQTLYNLRTKGLRNTSGTLIKGCVKDATSKLSIGSIPSNYETIIYHSQSTKAFGTSQKRFYQRNQNQTQKSDIPNQSAMSQQQSVKNPSHSTKGYGPFIAKQPRNWIEKKEAPGPGRYQYTKSADPNSKRLKKHRMNFVYEKKQNIVPVSNQKSQLPGPGQYYIFQRNHANNGWKSSFKTKLNRNSYLQNQNNPGPGYYDVNLVKHAKSIIKESPNKVENLSPSKLLDGFENKSKCQVPGPGAYQYDIPTFKPLYQRIKISGNFIINKKDRFNNNTDKLPIQEQGQDTPNVYSYNLKSQFDQQQTLMKWPCFMSGSKRVVFENEKKLGPSFLSSKEENRKNFHFNIKGAWF